MKSILMITVSILLSAALFVPVDTAKKKTAALPSTTIECLNKPVYTPPKAVNDVAKATKWIYTGDSSLKLDSIKQQKAVINR